MAKLYGAIIGAVAGPIVLAAAGLPGQTLVSADSDGLRVAQRLAAGMLEEIEIEAIFNGLMRVGKPLYKEHYAGCHGDGGEGVVGDARPARPSTPSIRMQPRAVSRRWQ